MSKLFEIPLGSGNAVEILFAAPPEPGAVPYGVGEELVQKGATTLMQAMEMVRLVGQVAIDALQDLDVESAEATVGLKLSAKGKFVVAEAATEASLSVKLTLKKRKT